MHSLQSLEKYCIKCNKCPLHMTRTNVVFGDGNPNAMIMFIGEGPGYNEDKQGKPFVGAAGQLFDKMLKAIEMKREDVYIANIVKCRPPDNRNPLAEEVRNCMEYLRWQVKLVNPKIIVCLGAISAQNIISKDFKITKDRGIWVEKGKFHIMPTFHPAALLRDENKKKPAWEDFKSIKKKYDELKSKTSLIINK